MPQKQSRQRFYAHYRGSFFGGDPIPGDQLARARFRSAKCFCYPHFSLSFFFLQGATHDEDAKRQSIDTNVMAYIVL